MSFYECRWCGQFVAFFFFNDTATTEIYTLSLHDALPISGSTHRVLMSCCSIFWSVDRGVAPVRCDLVRVLRLPLSHMLLRSEEHTSELQSRQYLVCRLLLEKKKKRKRYPRPASRTLNVRG